MSGLVLPESGLHQQVTPIDLRQPSCGAARAVPIVYGMRVIATVAAPDLGLLMIWGCLVRTTFRVGRAWRGSTEWGLDDRDAAARTGSIVAAMRKARAGPKG